jgi:hypothetical protein
MAFCLEISTFDAVRLNQRLALREGFHVRHALTHTDRVGPHVATVILHRALVRLVGEVLVFDEFFVLHRAFVRLVGILKLSKFYPHIQPPRLKIRTTGIILIQNIPPTRISSLHVFGSGLTRISNLQVFGSGLPAFPASGSQGAPIRTS